MKLLLALLAIGVVTAHWTHDDSLAREIGPPPGEEDVDVAALSDELISVTETTTADKMTYRVTIGTAWVDTPTKAKTASAGWWNGGSSQLLTIALKGRKGWSGNAQATIKDPQMDTTLRYYQGPFMDYELAGTVAPTLLPGLVPLIVPDPNTNVCWGNSDMAQGTLPKSCTESTALAAGRAATYEWDWCEPNTKSCRSLLKVCKDGDKDSTGCSGIGYATPPATVLADGKEASSTTLKMGLIQRGQIEYEDVGEITQVTAKSKTPKYCPPAGTTALTAWDCASPWYPKFIKINTNNAKTGIGNGIYYIHPMAGLHTSITENCVGDPSVCAKSDNMEIYAKPGAVSDTETVDSNGAMHNAELKKCVAQQCEEEMDSMYGLAAVKEEQ